MPAIIKFDMPSSCVYLAKDEFISMNCPLCVFNDNDLVHAICAYTGEDVDSCLNERHAMCPIEEVI